MKSPLLSTEGASSRRVREFCSAILSCEPLKFTKLWFTEIADPD
jgi:hypothetical protein